MSLKAEFDKLTKQLHGDTDGMEHSCNLKIDN